MGLYTDHWARHRRNSTRSTLQALLALGLGVPGIAGLGFLLSPLDDLRTGVLVVGIIAWLALLIRLVRRGSQVDCPRCSTRYSRGKFLVECPKCGLGMLQDGP